MRSWELKSFNVNGRLEKGSCVYFLAKIHKPNNPGRPSSLPGGLIFCCLDKIMAPIVKTSPSYIKDWVNTRLKFFATPI